MRLSLRAVAASLLSSQLPILIHARFLHSRRSVTPAPFQWEPSELFQGIDGSWSSWQVAVGTPAQFLYVLPSTASEQTWVVSSAGQPNASAYGAYAATYVQSRGPFFYANESKTWVPNGIFELHLDDWLWNNPYTEFGYDTVGLGVGPSVPTVEHSIVASYSYYQNTDYWLGVFGLDPKPTNFSTFAVQTPSFMTLLKQQNAIPSMSCGYTAGAYYKRDGNGALGSLTLGGYDQARFESNNVTFQFGTNNELSLTVGVKAITANTSSKSNIMLAPTGFYAAIDSTATQIWLPESAYQLFEQVFGLEYDESSSLYLVNETTHNTLQALNPSITFTLGNTLSSAAVVNITLPYGAFDLQVQYPYQGVSYSCLSEACYYFPIRRAINSTDITLGRTFLQEAYLSIDWDREVFNVSQCVWNGAGGVASPNIVTIPSTDPPSSAPFSLSTGATVGIAVGVFIAALLCTSAYLYLRHRRKLASRKAAAIQLEADRLTSDSASDLKKEHPLLTKPELDASQPYSGAEVEDKAATATALCAATNGTGTGTYTSYSGATAVDSDADRRSTPPAPPVEAEATEREIYEMPGSTPVPTELPSPLQMGLSAKEEAIERERIYNGVDPKENEDPAAGDPWPTPTSAGLASCGLSRFPPGAGV